MLVQDELTTREQVIHKNNLIFAVGRLVTVTDYHPKHKFESIG